MLSSEHVAANEFPGEPSTPEQRPRHSGTPEPGAGQGAGPQKGCKDPYSFIHQWAGCPAGIDVLCTARASTRAGTGPGRLPSACCFSTELSQQWRERNESQLGAASSCGRMSAGLPSYLCKTHTLLSLCSFLESWISIHWLNFLSRPLDSAPYTAERAQGYVPYLRISLILSSNWCDFLASTLLSSSRGTLSRGHLGTHLLVTAQILKQLLSNFSVRQTHLAGL